MRSIDIRGANDPPKSAKVLAGQGHGCKNGLGDITDMCGKTEQSACSMRTTISISRWLMNMLGLRFDTKHEQLMIYYREKNEAEAGLIKIYAYKIGENVKRFEEKF